MIPPLAAWGLSGTPEPLAGGHRNAVLRVGGHILKSTRRDEPAIAWLLPVLEAAEACGLRVARPIRSASGALVVDGWTCETRLPGVKSAVAPLAPMIRAFHEQAKGLPQRPGFASSQTLLHQRAGGDVDLNLLPADLVRAVRAAWSELAGNEQGIVHGDLNAGNILRDADGRYALIDWDEARRDVLAFDLAAMDSADPKTARAALAWEIACCWQAEPDRARSLARDFMA